MAPQQANSVGSRTASASQSDLTHADWGIPTLDAKEDSSGKTVSGPANATSYTASKGSGKNSRAMDEIGREETASRGRMTPHTSENSPTIPKQSLKIQTSMLNQNNKMDNNAVAGPKTASPSTAPLSLAGPRTRPRASTISAAAAKVKLPAGTDSDEDDTDKEGGPASASGTMFGRPKLADTAPRTARFASFSAITTTSQTVHVTQARPSVNTVPAVKVQIGSASSHWRRASSGSPASNASSTTSSAAEVSPPTLTTANRFAILDEEAIEGTANNSSVNAGQDTPVEESIMVGDAFTFSTGQVQVTSPKRPKSNTITGLAPQLWRAQRAAMEAAEGGTGSVSLLSGTNASASDGKHSNVVKSGTELASDQSYASYSSTDTVFAPAAPPLGSVLRSSRLRETISRRMTVSTDIRARNTGAERPAETQNGNDYPLYPMAFDVRAPADRRASEADGFYDRPDAPLTPRPLEVVGAALNQARANPTGAGECELCGILTPTLTVLLPCQHSACAACCSSGINQVSTSPPRSHVCAACRAPVESIALWKSSAEMAGGEARSLDDQETLAGSVETLAGDEGAYLDMSSSVGPIPIPSGLVASSSAHEFDLGATPSTEQHIARLQSPYGGPVTQPPAATVYGATFPSSALHPSTDHIGHSVHGEMNEGTQGGAGLLPGFEPQSAYDAAADALSELEMSPSSPESDVSQCAVVRIDNIPWTVGCDDVMKWLPDPVFTLASRDVCAQSVHIPIDLQSGKTSNACFLVCRDRKAAQRIVRARTNTKLCGRPVTLILSTYSELLDEIFTTRNLSASLEDDRAVYFTEQQLERLLLLLKEGGGQLKDGSKPIEFASSLMALVPQRLAIEQREMLFNAVHDMVNYCLAVSGVMPSVRPALDRLLRSCSMCGAFAPDQKMTVIETARAALSAMMVSESMQKKGSPRARKSSSLTLAVVSDGQRPPYYGGTHEETGFRSRNRQMHPSPRPFCSPIHASGMVAPALSPMAHYKTVDFHSGPYYGPTPYATPPYAAHDGGMHSAGHQNDGTDKMAEMEPVGGSAMRLACGPGYYAAGGMMPPGQQNMPHMFTPECSPYGEMKTTFPSPNGRHNPGMDHATQGPPTPMRSEHGPAATMHPPSYYGGMVGMGMGPSAMPGPYGAYPGTPGPLLPPYGYPVGMPPSSSSPMPMQNMARPTQVTLLGGPGPRGLVGVGGAYPPSQVPVEGSTPYQQLGLYQGGTFNGQPGANAASVDPSMANPLRPVAPAGPPSPSVDFSTGQANVGDGTAQPTPASLRNDVSVSLQKLMRSGDVNLAEGGSGGSSGEEVPSLATIASVLPKVKQDEDEFERLVEAVAQAMMKKKDGREGERE
ncbi:unnamed protein product [Tilletia laevis]|nr:hypothetical protein A4X03_0g1099 [Tilletia caries]CAD6900715.1 unnamed protein product [Tilletia laevis]